MGKSALKPIKKHNYNVTCIFINDFYQYHGVQSHPAPISMLGLGCPLYYGLETIDTLPGTCCPFLPSLKEHFCVRTWSAAELGFINPQVYAVRMFNCRINIKPSLWQ